MCASSFRCVCTPGVGSEVIRIAVCMPIDQITFSRILRPEEFPRFCRLQIRVPTIRDPLSLTPGWINAVQCENVWRLVAAPSSVENLTVDYAVPMFCEHRYGATQLAAALKNPGIALRHITLRGTTADPCMQKVASAVVAISSQLETLRLVELDSFLCNALDKRKSTKRAVIACRRLQFSSVGFIPQRCSANKLLVGWDRLFGDPHLRCIVVSNFQSCCHWPRMIDPPPPPPVVPGRRVIIELQDRTSDKRTNNGFHWDAIPWLKRLASTATEVEFRIDSFNPYLCGMLRLTNQAFVPWMHATLHSSLFLISRWWVHLFLCGDPPSGHR